MMKKRSVQRETNQAYILCTSRGFFSGTNQAMVPPLREPTRSQEVNAKKRRRLAPVGMTSLCGATPGAGKDSATKISTPIFGVGRVESKPRDLVSDRGYRVIDRTVNVVASRERLSLNPHP